MSRSAVHIKLLFALMFSSVTLSTSSAFAQSQESRPDTRLEHVTSDVDTLKAENAAVRELLRKMEEQQRVLLEQVDRLQRRLDGAATAVVPPSPPSPNAPVPAPSAGSAPAQTASVAEKPDRYKDGIVIWENPRTRRSLSC
jgi:hypothetical protein